MADLFELPSAADVGLRCTNLRDMNGKRPVFVDDPNSIFFFPYIHMRFVEISPRAIASIPSHQTTALSPAHALGNSTRVTTDAREHAFVSPYRSHRCFAASCENVAVLSNNETPTSVTLTSWNAVAPPASPAIATK